MMHVWGVNCVTGMRSAGDRDSFVSGGQAPGGCFLTTSSAKRHAFLITAVTMSTRVGDGLSADPPLPPLPACRVHLTDPRPIIDDVDYGQPRDRSGLDVGGGTLWV